MANEIVMTKEGYDDLVKELNELKTTRRAEISEKIRVARGFGDLSENSEYDEAKNEQAIVEARILTLENQLKNVKIIEKSDTVKGTVSLGSFVTIRDVEFGDEMTYRIISSVESSNDMSTITDESPVGKALLGHKAGETVEVTIPSGAQIEYQIIKVEYIPFCFTMENGHFAAALLVESYESAAQNARIFLIVFRRKKSYNIEVSFLLGAPLHSALPITLVILFY